MEKALEHANGVLAHVPGLQLSMLQNARQQALEELTKIDEALAQVQNSQWSEG